MKVSRWFVLVAVGCAGIGLVQGRPPIAAEASGRPKVRQLGSNILIDQFGYLPTSQKVAVIRDPKAGYDTGSAFTPGSLYAVVDIETGAQVTSGPLKPWGDGAVDASSGDAVSWFDFSSLTATGRYYVLDVQKNVRSAPFRISTDVYKPVLRAAVRTFFLQRAGFEKRSEYAGAWADKASHMGPGQDRTARLFTTPEDVGSERDLSGGWYDAGDADKYTNWTAQYVITLLKAFRENPSAFGDDFGIPESGNGVSDLIDEVRWGVDSLIRLQEANGSVLSIVSLSEASPPSEASGPSRYGPASTSATLSTAAAFAIAAQVFGSQGDVAYAQDLLERAKRSYAWAAQNPNVVFRNNDAAAGTQGVGHGQQETDDYGRLTRRIEAAVYLFQLTKDPSFKLFIDENYHTVHLIQWGHASPFEADAQEALLIYSTLGDATAEVAHQIRGVFARAMESEENMRGILNDRDPYRSYIQHYTWGSNHVKSLQGGVVYQLITYGFPSDVIFIENSALGYIHYIHGINPLGMVYLTNMSQFGADRSATSVYHFWFNHESRRWSRVGSSIFGPPPGFLVGGANPGYDWDSCCPAGCGIKSVICFSENLNPPKNQPAQKSYKDFNVGWPLNSWSVSENSNGYQASYIRLLSKFVGRAE